MIGNEPWFRRWFGFSFKPIAWQGWATVIAFLLIELAIMLVADQVEDGSRAWWLLAATGLALFFVFWAFALSKTETL
jgi:hypothetical protein